MNTLNDVQAVIASLDNTPGILLPLIREVPVEWRKRRPHPEKWSAHEHFCHLSTLHPLFNARIDLMLANTDPEIVPYFPDAAEEGGGLLNISLEDAAARLVNDRAAFVARLKQLSESDWRRTARHGEYSHYSIFILCRHVAMHDLLHGYRIEELLLKKSWGEQ